MLGLDIALPRVNSGPFLYAHQPIRTASDLSFEHFIRRVNPRYIFYPHVTRLLRVLDGVLDGSIRRLMVFMPPRHFKSETISRLFSAYYLYRWPSRWVGLTSYGAELAYALSRNARTNFELAGGTLRQAKAMRQWETDAGGGMWAAGVGGAATGKGFDLGIIDDPVKNAEEAASETIRLKQQDWYRSVFTTRQMPNAAIIVIQTRWHEADLSGWLLAQEGEEHALSRPLQGEANGSEGWHVVSMEAIKRAQLIAIPSTCTLEPDPRSVGEALCPERYPLSRLQTTRSQIGSYFWSALYDQRPTPPEGAMFQRQWFDIVGAAPAQAARVRYWDKAGTEGGGDYSAGVLLARDGDGVFYIEDVVRGQWSALGRERIIRQTAELDHGQCELYGAPVPSIWIEQEPGSGGKESAQSSLRNLAGFSAYAEPVTGDKSTRAMPFAAQCEARNVKLVRGGWNAEFLEEVCTFPYGRHDDMVDAASGSFAKLTAERKRAGTW